MLEKVAMASIREQQANRRWKTFVRMAWLLFFAVLAWMFFQRGAPDAAKMTSPHTAVIEIRGDIADGADSSAANIVPAVKRAFEDAGSRAVVLSINSGGGSPVQAGIINDELMRMKAHYKKPLYAVVGDSCASGACGITIAYVSALTTAAALAAFTFTVQGRPATVSNARRRSAPG